MLSSSVYLFNDIIDMEKDRMHPKKRMRPIASGQISQTSAVIVGSLLCIISLLLGLSISITAFIFLVAYVVNNLLYTLYLKNKVIADVMSISIGFMIRFISGAYIINVEPSRWLLVCGFALALFLAFGKRRTEMEIITPDIKASDIRPILETYSKEKLNSALAVINSLCILAYLLYATDPVTINRLNSDKLIYTAPIVVYCLFRYMYKVQEGRGSGPVEIVLKDKAFIGAILLWFVIVFAVIYI